MRSLFYLGHPAHIHLFRHTIEELGRSGNANSSERPLPPELGRYRARIDPSQLQDLLASADLYIGDSQTIAAEAAVRGIPSIRYNGFVGRIGYLRELEEDYEPHHRDRCGPSGPASPDRACPCGDGEFKKQWADRRRRLLEETVDLTNLLVWLIQSYPESRTLAAQDSAVRDRFRFCAPLQ